MQSIKSIAVGLYVGVAAFGLASVGVAPAAHASPITSPTGLNPGDQYRLVFVSNDKRDATSSNIADYNSFVTGVAAGVAELSALGTNWSAIASTASVDARVNTATDPTPAGDTGVPIYLLDGTTLIATEYDDLWGGFGGTNNPIDINNNGDTIPLAVQQDWAIWTGTTSNGTGLAGFGLGDATPVYGDARVGLGFNGWVFKDGIANTNAYRLYAISDVLTIPTPPPTGCVRNGGTILCTGIDPDGLSLPFNSGQTIEVVETATVLGTGIDVGETGFPSNLNKVTNRGRIMPDELGVDFRRAIEMVGDNNEVQNLGGTITIEGNGPPAILVGLTGDNNFVRNIGGTIMTQGNGQQAHLIEMIGNNNSVFNVGTITTDSGDDRSRLIFMTGNDLLAVNSGVLSASGDGAVGIEMFGNNNGIGNQGSVLVTGGFFEGGTFRLPASAINLEEADNTTFINGATGTLRALGTESVAVTMNAFPLFNPAGRDAAGLSTTLENNGMIQADGIAVIGANGDETVINSGDITGDVLLGAGHDIFFIVDRGFVNGMTDGGADDDMLIANIGTRRVDHSSVFFRGEDFINFENFQKLGAAPLTLYNTFNVDAVRVDGGRLTLAPGSQLVAADGVTVGAGGILTGAVNIVGDLIVEDGGGAAPGFSPGDAFVSGDLTVMAGGMLVVEIGGAATGDFDRFFVGGDAFLYGILELVFINDFLPQLDQVFSFMQVAGSIFGAFEEITVRGMSLVDLKLDIVGGEVSLTRLVISANVPEPGTLAIFVFGLAGLGFIRRRRAA
jgi:PEP-CTERM motif